MSHDDIPSPWSLGKHIRRKRSLKSEDAIRPKFEKKIFPFRKGLRGGEGHNAKNCSFDGKRCLGDILSKGTLI